MTSLKKQRKEKFIVKFQVELLNAVAYLDKKTYLPKTRIGYRYLETKYKQNTEKFKGYSELEYYLDTHDVFNKLTENDFGVQCELEFVETQNSNNPLKRRLSLKSIKVGNNVINIL